MTDLQVAIHIAITDVSDTAAVSSLPDSLPAEFHEVDILVNNAGRLFIKVLPLMASKILWWLSST